MKRIFAFCTILTLCLTSCIPVTQKIATGPIEERTIAIPEGVVALAMSSGFDVKVDSTLPSGEIRVTTHTDMFDRLDIGVEQSTLNIGMKSHRLRAKVLEVRIPALRYETIAVSGGVDFEWQGCNVAALTVAASGGADLMIEGECKSLMLAASGGADAELSRLRAENVEVAASGGADVEVCALNTLSVNASGGADVEYVGTPSVKNINRSGGAEVSAKN